MRGVRLSSGQTYTHHYEITRPMMGIARIMDIDMYRQVCERVLCVVTCFVDYGVSPRRIGWTKTQVRIRFSSRLVKNPESRGRMLTACHNPLATSIRIRTHRCS